MYQRYRDPLLKIGGLTALDAYFKNIDDRIVSSAVAVLGSNVMLNAGGELARTRAEGNSIDVAAERLQAGGFVSGRYVLLEESGPLDDLSLFPSLRLDAFNTSRPAWSPQMACVIAFREFDGPLVNKLRPIIRGSISRNFRLPTFNELYYAGGGGFGNRLLRPERSITLEAGGGLYAEWNGYHVVRFSFFRNEMEDRIVWSPSGVMAVTPRNIRDVESGGTELSYVWDPLHGTLLLDANYAYIESRKTSADYPGDPNVNKRLVYVPTHAASLALTWSTSRPVAPIDRFGCVLSYQLVGRRFASEDNTTVLPAYDVADGTLFASWRLSSFEFQTRFEVRNLFDESYQIILGYPMPLRSYRVTLGLEY
jgi:outer membrane receptor protein involved in Fe transport